MSAQISSNRWGHKFQYIKLREILGFDLSNADRCALDLVPSRTQNLWKNKILEHGMIPLDYSDVMSKEKARKGVHHGTVMTESAIQVLKGIVDDHPDYYLDELRDELKVREGILVSAS